LFDKNQKNRHLCGYFFLGANPHFASPEDGVPAFHYNLFGGGGKAAAPKKAFHCNRG
jgi:hypothetical protein